MGLYANCIAPQLCHLAMRNTRLVPYRQRALADARGRVLEVGIGSGLNLPLYAPSVERVLGLDPSAGLIARAAQAASRARVPVDLFEGSAECIPLDAASVDTVVMTWVGCSIPDIATALAEMRRVLKPGGSLLFVEHGRSPETRVAHWQDRLDPFWHRISAGCHLNRRIVDLLPAAGFRVDRLETGYMGRPKLLTYLYEGRAVAA